MCEVPTYKQPGTNSTTDTVYALRAVALIPFFDIRRSRSREETKESMRNNPRQDLDSEKIADVAEKITEYLSEGFYFAQNYDLTSNLQRQRRLYEQHGFDAKDHTQQNFSWNRNLLTKLQA